MNIFTNMENTPFQAVIFKEKMPLLETELNELQMLAFTRQREIFRHFLGDNACLGHKGTQSSFENGTLVLNGIFLLDGILIKCENARAGGLSWGDTVYLSFDIKEAGGETVLHENGYEYGIQIENTIKDNRFPVCTTGRMYLSFILGNVPVPGAEYCKDIGTIEKGEFICTLPGGIPYILEKITNDLEELQETVKNDIIKRLDSLDAEDVGALPADGTAQGSYSILNCFSGTSLNDVDYNSELYKSRLKYFIVGSIVTEGKPPFNAFLLNMGWNENGYGAQLAIEIGGEALVLRGKKTDGTFRDWIEFLSTKNYSSEIRRINNQLILVHGSYVSKQLGTNGTAGIINFMRIKVTGSYANHPLYFLLSGRGRQMPMLVCVHFASVNSVDPELNSFYRLLTDGYDVYIHKTSASTWDLYAPKNEPYGSVDVLHIWYSSDVFQISYPNTQVASASSSWIKATTAGIVENANALKDCGNGTQIHISYSKTGLAMNNTTWIAGWNNYELRAIHRNYFMQAKNLNGYYGMVVGNYEDNVWVRTTSRGIIPYQSGGRGYGHQQLGTDSWYFLKSYIDQMHGVTLDLSGTITSRVNTNTYINGAKGINVGINMLNAGDMYTILATLKSANGVFCIGQYQGAIHVYFIANSLINAYTNGVTKDLKLLDESGNSVFPGTVTAKGGFSSGVSSSFNAANIATATITTLTVNGSVRLKKSGSNYGMKLNFGDGEYVYLHENSDDYLTIYAKNGTYFRVATQRGTDGILLKGYTSDNHLYFQPLTDGYGNIGSPGNRFNQFYAKNSGISTSDRTLKKDISYLGKNSRYDTYMDDETLRNFVSGLLPCIYRLIENENNRPHHGFIAQDIEELMRQLGIKDHAGFIKSPKTKTIEIEEEAEEEYVDEADGQTKTRTVIHKREEQRKIPGEYIYGLRYEEFIADIVRFVQIQDGRIEKQQEVINKQQETIKAQDAKIQELEKRFEALENLLKERGIL